jgi:tocopherol O-methyltransferase
MDKEAVKKYYSDTQFEYKLIWNWRLKTTPALHFGYYDEKANNHQQAIIRANEVLAEFADIRPGSRVVDAGCGLGHSSEWLAKQLGAIVTGITIVPKQVDTINRRLQKHPVANVDFLVADYLHMPFADNSVDIVWAFESVCHAASKLEFYKEAYRVLKPGGRIAMAEYIRTGRPMTGEKEKLLQAVFSPWAIPDLDTIKEHEQHARQAGFHAFKHRDITPHVVKSYRNLRETCRRYAALSKLLYKTGVISLVRHQNMLSSLQQADALEQHVFTYHHIVCEK